MRGIAATQDRGRRLRGAEGVEDAVLQGAELLLLGGLFAAVLGDVDVDDAAGGDVGREEDGREFDLGRFCSSVTAGQCGLFQSRLGGGCTRRLSGVKSTVTPASTLPTVRETSMLGFVASWGWATIAHNGRGDKGSGNGPDNGSVFVVRKGVAETCRIQSQALGGWRLFALEP